MAEIQGGGAMPHQQLHHHRVQMVMNHHMDLDCHQTGLEIHPANISKFNRIEKKKDFFAPFVSSTHKIYRVTIDVLEKCKSRFIYKTNRCDSSNNVEGEKFFFCVHIVECCCIEI